MNKDNEKRLHQQIEERLISWLFTLAIYLWELSCKHRVFCADPRQMIEGRVTLK